MGATSFRALVAPLDDVDEAAVAQALIWMARTSADPTPSVSLWGSSSHAASANANAMGYRWDIDAFVHVLNDKVSINWTRVYQLLDAPDFIVADLRALELLIRTHDIATRVCLCLISNYF